ncbi:MAG TPA: hypothetical protein VFD02_07710 [Syntrophomonadaceae bacterium]|nr:hypothetical protein [Syntrophomonadaceae bacterium]
MAKKNNLHFVKNHSPSKTSPIQPSKRVNLAYQSRHNRNQEMCKIGTQYTKASCNR